MENTTPKLPVVILISGNGSNLQAIIDAVKNGLPIDIRAVISNRVDAHGLIRAKKKHIPTHCIPHKNYESRQKFELALQTTIMQYNPKLIVLAGFMRHLTVHFVTHFYGKIINIHPSLLPKYPGLNTHRRVLEAGDQLHGATIHFVSKTLDSGPGICQARLKVCPDDTEQTLKQRVQQLEHRIYPQVLDWFAHNRVSLKKDSVELDHKMLPPSGKILSIF